MSQLVVILLTLWIPVAILQQCNETLVRQQRIAKIGETILVKLGIPEPPDNPPTHTPPSSEMIAEFEAVQATLSILESSRKCSLQFEVAKSADLINATSASEAPSILEDFCIPDVPSCDDPVVRQQPQGNMDSQHGCRSIEAPTLSYRFVFPLNLTNRVFTSLDLVTTKLPSPKFGDGDWVEINLLYPCYGNSKCVEDETKRHEVITGKLVTSQVEGFEVFNVTRAVQRWMDRLQLIKPVGDLELEIRIRPPVSLHCNGRPFLPSISFNSTETYLLMFFRTDDQMAKQRRKRQAVDSALNPEFCFKDPNITNCCIRELIINFEEDLGWTWVLMPPAFAPNYCLGLCPYTWPAATNATGFLQLYHDLNPTSAVEPCCATQTLSSLNMIAIMNGERVHTVIPDVIVNSCICK